MTPPYNMQKYIIFAKFEKHRKMKLKKLLFSSSGSELGSYVVL